MKLQDLYNSVSQLGFEDSLGDDGSSRFIYATNRALIEVDSLRPRRKRKDINHRVPNNLLFSEPVTIEKDQTLTFTARGAKSYYFEVSGVGSYSVYMIKEKVEDGKKTTYKTADLIGSEGVESFNSPTVFLPIKGFIKDGGVFIDTCMQGNTEDDYYTGEVAIEFSGDYDYTIRNLAMYDRVYSASEEDIVPYGKTVGYCMYNHDAPETSLVDDFDRFDSPPLDSNGMHLFEGYSVTKDTVYLPIDKQGIYTIKYLHKVKPIDVYANINDPDIEIDLEDDLAAILPNLVAAYVWLDDEPDKAQYYYNLYLQRAEQIKRQSIDLNPIEFKSVYGW
jgi:hypothetical protein